MQYVRDWSCDYFATRCWRGAICGPKSLFEGRVTRFAKPSLGDDVTPFWAGRRSRRFSPPCRIVWWGYVKPRVKRAEERYGGCQTALRGGDPPGETRS